MKHIVLCYRLEFAALGWKVARVYETCILFLGSWLFFSLLITMGNYEGEPSNTGSSPRYL